VFFMIIFINLYIIKKNLTIYFTNTTIILIKYNYIN